MKACGCRSMHKIAYTARRATSKTPARTSTGSAPKAVAALPTRACEGASIRTVGLVNYHTLALRKRQQGAAETGHSIFASVMEAIVVCTNKSKNYLHHTWMDMSLAAVQSVLCCPYIVYTLKKWLYHSVASTQSGSDPGDWLLSSSRNGHTWASLERCLLCVNILHTCGLYSVSVWAKAQTRLRRSTEHSPLSRDNNKALSFSRTLVTNQPKQGHKLCTAVNVCCVSCSPSESRASPTSCLRGWHRLFHMQHVTVDDVQQKAAKELSAAARRLKSR